MLVSYLQYVDAVYVVVVPSCAFNLSRGKGHDDSARSPRCEGTEQEVCIATGCRHESGV